MRQPTQPTMPCLGDIEASGLAPESYPIEIAWSLPSGEIRASLIQIHASWGNYWDPVAEAMHHINREMLRAEGLPAAEVAKRLNQDLAGEKVYFDGGGYDQHWLGRLFEAAGMKPSFKFRDFDTLLAIAGVRDSSRLRDECLSEHWFINLDNARQLIETWRQEYNQRRPKRDLGGLTPRQYAQQLRDESATLVPGL